LYEPRRNEVRAAEGGQEIVDRRLVGQVNDRESQTPLVAVTAKKVVLADADIKQVAGFDARRVVVRVKTWRLQC